MVDRLREADATTSGSTGNVGAADFRKSHDDPESVTYIDGRLELVRCMYCEDRRDLLSVSQACQILRGKCMLMQCLKNPVLFSKRQHTEPTLGTGVSLRQQLGRHRARLET